MCVYDSFIACNEEFDKFIKLPFIAFKLKPSKYDRFFFGTELSTENSI